MNDLKRRFLTIILVSMPLQLAAGSCGAQTEETANVDGRANAGKPMPAAKPLLVVFYDPQCTVWA
jgi:hypothetical protein